MPIGLQVMNSYGTVTCDITDRFTRIETFITVTPGTSGMYTLKAIGTPFFAVLNESATWTQNVSPTFTISGQSVLWSGGQGATVEVMMGVY